MMSVMPRLAAITALAIVVVASAIACVYAKHESRKLFTELQGLVAERDRLDVEWGRLQIEHSTWSTYGRVEQVARKQMHMRPPRPDEIQLMQP